MAEPELPKEKKIFDPENPTPCAGCSNCCEYIALELDKPTTLKDFDQIIWYLLHKDVWVYIDDSGDWYMQFNTVCEKLENRRCTYYPHRPHMCRDYDPADCIRYEGEQEEVFFFKNEEDLFRYLAKKRPKTFQKLKEKNNIPFKA